MEKATNTSRFFNKMTRIFALALTILLGIALPNTNLINKQLPSIIPVAKANNTAHVLTAGTPFSQDWTNTGLITTNDDWGGVTSIVGFRGDNLVAGTGADPQTVLTEGTPVVDVNVNQTNPDTFSTGGVAEFHITNPVVALSGSGTAKAPHLVIYLDTTGCSSPNRVGISYNLRDLDGSADNAVQQIALQYRTGGTGNYTNVATGYVADATTGPSQATLVTPINVILPSAVTGQTLSEVRIITTDAAGNDEWVGIDDINVQCLPPTASNGTIGGRVTTASGRGISKSIISLTGPGLSQPRYAFTNPFGYYSFSDVLAGENYVVTVQAKGFVFNQPSMLLNVNDDITEVNFVALP